jgi:hypothetical protein
MIQTYNYCKYDDDHHEDMDVGSTSEGKFCRKHFIWKRPT